MVPVFAAVVFAAAELAAVVFAAAVEDAAFDVAAVLLVLAAAVELAFWLLDASLFVTPSSVGTPSLEAVLS